LPTTAAGKRAENVVGGYKMKVKILNQKANMLSFLLEGATPAYANALRRIVIEDVPTMAVEVVEFRKNSSALFDEVVALRLGLCPLKTDLKSYNIPEECACGGEGCARCQLKLTLVAKGLKNGVTVRAGDIKSKDPKVKPIYPEMPLVKLFENQKIEIEMTAILGRGKEHVKWSSGHAYYRQVPYITISKKGEKFVECEKLCPTAVFETKKGKLVVGAGKEYDCILCGACIDATNGEVNVKTNQEDYLFFIESWGQLSPKVMIIKSIEILDAKADELIAAIKGTPKKKTEKKPAKKKTKATKKTTKTTKKK